MKAIQMGNGSSFDELRKLVAIPSLAQLELIRAAAQMLCDSINRGTLLEPGKRFDLRFTFDDLDLNEHPVAALMVFNRLPMNNLEQSEILLNVHYPNLPVLFVHEIAHYYDLFCFNPFGSFSSNRSSEFADWRAVIDETETFRRHRVMLAAQSGNVISETIDAETGMHVPLAPNIDEDLRDWVYIEAFARCFCQWMVRQWNQNSSEHIQAVVDYFHRERTNDESTFLASYWTDEEMGSIDKAMTALFAPRVAH